MSKLIQKFKRWLSGVTATVLMMGILTPGLTLAVEAPTLGVPLQISPTDGAYVTTANLNKIDWEDVVHGEDIVSYEYQISNSKEVDVDGSLTGTIYSRAESEILTPETPENIYYWQVRAVVLTSGLSSDWSDPWKFSVDNTAPTAKTISIASDGKDPKWAKPGDTVALSFATDEDVTATATINGISAKVTETKDGYVASRVFTKLDVEGPVSFELQLEDVAGNTGVAVVATTDASNVTFDKSAPALTDAKAYSEKVVARSSEVVENDNFLDENGVVITENNKAASISTSWKLVSKAVGDIASYEVTYVATDLAGNISNKIVEKVSLGSKVVTKEGTLLNLNGTAIALSERGEAYDDAGAKLAWNGEAAHVWTAGNLNLNKVGEYKLQYFGNDLVGVASSSIATKVTPVTTRTVTVKDSVGPAAVTNLVAVSGAGYIQLSWDNPTNDDYAGLDIYRSTSKSKIGDPIARAITAETSSYDDYEVVNGVTYYYTLRTYDLHANNGPYSKQVVGAPVASKIVSTEVVLSTPISDTATEPVVEEEKEVKSDQEEKVVDNTKTKSEVPTVGIIILVLLIALGLYLLYLQNPQMFAKLNFWKKNVKTKK